MGRRRYALSFFIVAFVALTLALSLQFVVVRGISMEPTCHDGDFLICSRGGEIRRGDVVVLQDKSSTGLLCKRVIALSGDEITIHGNRVNVNDYMVQEPYLYTQEWTSGFSGVVPDNSVYVLGDNRTDSRDSRDFGYVSMDAVRGVLIFNVTKSLGVSYEMIRSSILGLLLFLVVLDIVNAFWLKFHKKQKQASEVI